MLRAPPAVCIYCQGDGDGSGDAREASQEGQRLC